MSAVMEHQGPLDCPASNVTKARRVAVLGVAASLTPPGQEAQVMAQRNVWRIAAKPAQAALPSQSRRPSPAPPPTRRAQAGGR